MKEIEFVETKYGTDLKDKEWDAIAPFFPVGNKSKYHKRSLVNAVLHLVKTGCQWRNIPHEYPPYASVWSFFRRARDSGLWGLILDKLVQMTRIKDGRNASPSYALIDSQSVKTVSASEERGIDGGKKTKGRKRHIVVDTMGNLLAIIVHAANIHDTKSGIFPAKRAFKKYPTIEKFCGDAGYRKSFEEDVAKTLELGVDIVMRTTPEFILLPKRWVVERTFAWANHSRRLSKDYEITITSAEAMFIISHIHTLLRRMCR
jgi:putative transposase